jgi:hypothetical protein
VVIVDELGEIWVGLIRGRASFLGVEYLDIEKLTDEVS